MKIALLHISDIHFRNGWDENFGPVFRALFDDVERQMAVAKNTTFYVVISGDVVQAGDEIAAYNLFLGKFGDKLTALGIPKSQRICVPGNHDVSRTIIEQSLVVRNPILLDSDSGFDWTVNPILTGQRFSPVLPVDGLVF